MPATRKIRKGILSDNAIMERCPTAFAQGGARTYGLIKIDGAPNELGQRPQRADGLINTLSRQDVGQTVDTLSQSYRSGINSTALNPIIFMPTPVAPVPYSVGLSPYPTASRPITRAATPMEARDILGSRRDSPADARPIVVLPRTPTPLGGDLDLRDIDDSPGSSTPTWLVEAQSLMSTDGGGHSIPIASPVMSLNSMGKQPIRAPNVSAVGSSTDFVFRTPSAMRPQRVMRTRASAKKEREDPTSGMTAVGEIDEELDEIDRSMLLANSLVQGQRLEMGPNLDPPPIRGRARDRRESEGPRVQQMTVGGGLPERRIAGMGMVQQPFAEVPAPANISVPKGALIASAFMREKVAIYTQKRADTPRMETDAMQARAMSLAASTEALASKNKMVDIPTYQAIASTPMF